MALSTPSPTATLPEWRQIQRLLTLAAHRNKNQHSHARWWSTLGMLRRAVGRLVAEMEELGGLETERRGRGFKSRGGGEEKVLEGVERRETWMRGVLVGRCWVAFSALVADNQYSALGLMLVGTLARINRLLGPDTAVDVDNVTENSPLPQGRERRAEVLQTGGRVREMEGIGDEEEIFGEVDLGERIERTEIEKHDDLDIDGNEAGGETGGRDTGLETVEPGGVRGESRPDKVEKRSLDVGNFKDVGRTEKRKKKKKRKGDAIDDLFAGLL